jgi:hypothetical protein
MDEEVMDEIRPDDSTQESGQQANDQTRQATDEKPDGVSDQSVDGGTGKGEEAHPLEPGGKRFNQVYARAKDAESKYHAERERAARLEGELEALRKQPAASAQQAAPARYTGSQLQTFIDEGKITVGQALSYQEETLKLEAARLVEQKVEEKLSTVTRQSTVQREVARYKEAIPDIDVPGTEAHQKLEREYTFLVNMGYDAKDPKTEILAARAAFGDPDLMKQKQAARTITTGRDTMQDIAANGKPKPSEKDPLKDLSSAQRQHYQRMIDKGVYTGWAEVKEELAFVPPRR